MIPVHVSPSGMLRFKTEGARQVLHAVKAPSPRLLVGKLEQLSSKRDENS